MTTTSVERYEPSSLVAVEDQCSQIEAYAETCGSVPELRDLSNRLAAIDEYLNRTSTEGRARVAAAMRRLEARIGELDDKRKPGPSSSVATDELTRHERYEFRQMAEHPEVVEEVIAESTDEVPASRRKVMERIREAKAKHPIADDNKRSPANVRAREQKLKEMAEVGYTSRQIAEALDVDIKTVTVIAKRVGAEIHADKVVGKTRLHDSNRIVSEGLSTLEGVAMAFDLVEVTDLDVFQVEAWATSLSNSLRSLNRLAKQLKEMAHGQR